MLDFDAIAQTPVATDPFPFFLTESAMNEVAVAAANADFPGIDAPGVFPLSELSYGPRFQSLIDDIQSPRMRGLMEEKFGVNLKDCPQMITVRGFCRLRDGKIHTDSLDKIVTVLLYLNEDWGRKSQNTNGGRLRLLRNGHDIEDALAEVPPHGGTMVAFKRTDNSWHGHLPYEGERRYIMFNWMQDDNKLGKNLLRHRLSARVKKIIGKLFSRNHNNNNDNDY